MLHPCSVIETAPHVAICRRIEVEESGKPRLVHTSAIAVLLSRLLIVVSGSGYTATR